MEQRGILITHILNYVNDLIPESKEDAIDDPVVKMAWITIKIELKADLVKWKDTCNKRSEAGKKGGRPKKEEKQKKAKKPNAFLENQTKAKKADNEYEYDNEYVLSNDNNIVSKDTCGEVSQDKPSPLIELPCIKGYIHKVYEDDIKHYKELYPAVDVLQELKKMLGWIESNPKNRKTESGIKSFITRWLSKCQDKAPKCESSLSNKHDLGGFHELGDEYLY